MSEPPLPQAPPGVLGTATIVLVAVVGVWWVVYVVWYSRRLQDRGRPVGRSLLLSALALAVAVGLAVGAHAWEQHRYDQQMDRWSQWYDESRADA
ncbi:hypothetical protein [Luteimicrobium subarcticum]|uniref:Uncharacterized protein n=1 Tax=Luteimicrobium subarcticum TaxID=620910 RepID=A0A2M8WVP0_9MICO|nr:hypothetical protein [Luteimicrobium subarcticum]PJI94966.1 hypothetical protein CLV34_0818 [Luteimicrobium subarcticum]